jgi:hypothetical protein
MSTHAHRQPSVYLDMASKTILLHIGTSKTGTTSIHQAERSGQLGRIRYPLWGSTSNHVLLALLYFPYAELSPGWYRGYPANDRRFQRTRDRFRSFLFEQLRSSDGAVISWEGLSTLSTDQAMRLRIDLESLGFRNFHIVLYVRDPADLYLSRTQQRLKNEHETQLVKDPDTVRYEFAQVAQRWAQVFPGSLIVRRFPTDPDRDVVDDFSDVLQRCMGVSLPRIPSRFNTTLSAEAMQILQDYREAFRTGPDDGVLTPDTAHLARFLQQSTKDLSQTKPELKTVVADRIRANHRADAKQLVECCGVDLGLPDHDPGPLPPHPSPYRVEEIVRSIDPMIIHQLLLRLARAELSRRPSQRPLPLRLAARAYHAVPDSLRPPRLDDRLRQLFTSKG